MQTTDFHVCNMGLFGENVRHFWTCELGGLLVKHPELEFPHIHDFYMILFVESAEGEIVIDHHKIRLDKAKVIIIRPGCISSIDINRNAEGKVICFTENFFSLRYNNNILYQFSFLKREAHPCVRLQQEQYLKWKALLDLLTDEFRKQKRESRKVLRSYLNIVLFEFERLHNPVAYIAPKKIKHDKVHQFEVLIEDNFVQRKLPSFYAQQLHISPNYLNKICKEETGQTAGDIIRKRIIIEAQRLLHYTHLTVNEIADKLGFESASYFVTFFRKNTGATPEQFRKNED